MPSLEITFLDNVPHRRSPLGNDDALLQSLLIGVYACSRNEEITLYTRTALELWDREPLLGKPAERCANPNASSASTTNLRLPPSAPWRRDDRVRLERSTHSAYKTERAWKTTVDAWLRRLAVRLVPRARGE